jgi:hypothetical protein
MNNNQVDTLTSNIEYVRGFKDAIEWACQLFDEETLKRLLAETLRQICDPSARGPDLEIITGKLTAMYFKVQAHHLTNIQELFG